MPKIKKAARGKHRWIGLSFSSKITNFEQFRYYLDTILSDFKLKYLDFKSEKTRKSCIIKVNLKDYAQVREKLDVNSENVFSITSSGKIRLVRQRLDSYFTID